MSRRKPDTWAFRTPSGAITITREQAAAVCCDLEEMVREGVYKLTFPYRDRLSMVAGRICRTIGFSEDRTIKITSDAVTGKELAQIARVLLDTFENGMLDIQHGARR